jgi:predicted RecB family nuclease
MERVLLDAAVVNRCRRRLHLDQDPAMATASKAPLGPAAQQRMADAAVHRRAVADRLAALHPEGWTELVFEPEVPATERECATEAAMATGAGFVWGGLLPRDHPGGRRGQIDLLLRHPGGGYVPVLVVRHKVSDPGAGARTAPLASPLAMDTDPQRRIRPHGGDQMRLAHALRMIAAAGHAAVPGLAGVIGLDADVILWLDLNAPTWPGGRSALREYDLRFADRLAVAAAARSGAEPLARPSRIVECRGCPWWPVCEAELTATRDVSLVVRGEDAATLRAAGVRTVDDLAARDAAVEPEVPLVGVHWTDAVALARAWLRNLTVVRRVRQVDVPRADVEVDVDMESFGDSGSYLWGCLLSGVDIGIPQGYHAFSTWEPLPTLDEGRSFAEFWQWFRAVRETAAARGLTFRAYCYNELAENRWLLASADRFGDQPGIPPRAEVEEFIRSDQWYDLFAAVREQFLCAHGKGLKTIAPVAGFAWRDAEAGGENSMRWYRDAVGMETGEPDESQRLRLLEYNEDDVRATFALRSWMSSSAVGELPYLGELTA